MEQTETQIKQACKKILKDLNIYHRHLFQDKYTKKGCADSFIIFKEVIFLEFKRPGLHLRPEQEEFRQLCEKNNVKFWMITSTDDLIKKIQGAR